MKLPEFNGKTYFENTINKNSEVVTIKDVPEKSFYDSLGFFEAEGYQRWELRESSTTAFCSLKKETNGIFINYYYGTSELTVVQETDSKYFDYCDVMGAETVAPQITQVHLEDFGMSYVVRLSDGRFILFDGGRQFEPDAESLYRCLKRGTNEEKPRIAAWIMTHPHSDHFHCFFAFMQAYAEDVVIEKFLFTFPEHDDNVHYPAVHSKSTRLPYDTSIYANIPRMLSVIETTGAEIYAPHTGQRYVIGDAVCDILASIDDTIHCSTNVNATSLVIRMQLGGQVILWAADAPFSDIKLSEKYGEYLKSDILQVPHHGFQSGKAEAEIRAYRLIRPEVCLLPVSDYNAYTVFCTYRPSTRFLMQDAGVLEMITGDEERPLTLPYTARPEGKALLQRKLLTGLNATGSRAWIFTDLESANPEDFMFTLLNTTHSPITVWVELFFENRESNLRYIKVEFDPRTMKKICIIGDEVDADAVYYNWMSLKEHGVPEDATFAVRFLCDTPIVVSHKNHAPTYYSTYNV